MSHNARNLTATGHLPDQYAVPTFSYDAGEDGPPWCLLAGLKSRG